MELMKILLVEDDTNEWEIYKDICNKRNDIEFIGMTGSDDEGIELTKAYMPEGIILDLELNNGDGKGTGFTFLEKLDKLNLKIKPKIIVATNVCSDSVYDFLHKNGVDFIFYKKQNNYSQENVINTLLLIRGYTETVKTKIKEDIGENKNVISNKINIELDLIGISTHLQGRKYLHDSILYIIENDQSNERITVIQYLVSKYKKSNSTISRAMQNAILHAWRISALEDLNTYYTAKINYETGVPTPTEFIYYYADRIKKQL